MKIYTKGGDRGETGLYGGERVSKNSGRIHAYGTLDELNAVIGLVRVLLDANHSISKPKVDLSEGLLRVQNELFQMGAELATPEGKKLSMATVNESQVEAMEVQIDQMESLLEPLKTFILPGGTELSARLHLARTVCRRAERELVALSQSEPVRPILVQYVNRLSDTLFVMARYANSTQGVADIPWKTPN